MRCLFIYMEEKILEHSIEPFFNQNSNILILGSFPSVKSREENFYDANKQNRFWKVLANIFVDELPTDEAEKKAFLTVHRIALWDVIASCDIVGSSDASIKSVSPSELNFILEKAPIEKLVLNGRKATQLFYRNQGKVLPIRNCKDKDIEIFELPSTSPANATFSLNDLILHWRIISR